MGRTLSRSNAMWWALGLTAAAICLSGLQSTVVASELRDDADLVFDDQSLSDNAHSSSSGHSIAKRSALDTDADVHDMLFEDPDIQNENWLWGSVKRIRRSIDQLMGTEKPRPAAPKSVLRNRRTSEHHRRDRLGQTAVRPKRQNDNEDDVDDEEAGSGFNSDPNKWKLFRVSFVAEQEWLASYSDLSNRETENFSDLIESSIEEEFRSHEIFGKVIKISFVDRYKVLIKVDITANRPIDGDDLKQEFINVIENTARIGSLTVPNIDHFNLEERQDEGDTGEEVLDCALDEWKCDSGSVNCIKATQKCDGIKQCADESDENDCEEHNGITEEYQPETTTETEEVDETTVLTEDIPTDTEPTDVESTTEPEPEPEVVTDEVTEEHIPDEVTEPIEEEEEEPKVDEPTTEANPIPICPDDNLWQCPLTGHYICESQKCDQAEDCPNGEDEMEEVCSTPTTQLPECRSDEFSCDISRCIPSYNRCDGYKDCHDGTDEQQCECEEHEFKCADNRCILKDKVCDSVSDCDDGSDEADCNTGCNESQFRCNDGSCIDAQNECDREPHCRDGEDEFPTNQNCPTPSCNAGEFQCANGMCINADFVCDGGQDCVDGSDESPIRNCEPWPSHGNDTSPADCTDDEFQCGNGECIPSDRRCDGRFDCHGAEDEDQCELKCPVFKCMNEEKCYSYEQHCDQVYDCQDGTDERGCPPPKCRSYDQFTCGDGQCISIHQKCDQRSDCNDGSDEANCTPERDGRLNLKTYPSAQTIFAKYIREGEEVVFQCRDEGPLRAQVKWVRPAGFALPPGTRDFNGRLEIPDIKLEHRGEYICEAKGYPSSTPGAQTSVSLNVERRNITEFPACGPDEATCYNGDCIKKSQVCDGITNCRDNSDEQSCPKKGRKCEPNEFQCANQKCVLKTWRCDGEDDCGDRSDESGCEASNGACRYDEFECADRQCIPKSYQCDTQFDCQDQTDEIGCAPPTISVKPPAIINLVPGDTFNISCRAVGVPVPLVTWRLNWGHIPAKCKTSSVNGYGVLTCPDVEVRDSGAYSCEVINIMGTVFVTPDTILRVDNDRNVCQQGTFNKDAHRQEDCINCFCFGVATQCSSADLYTYSLPPRVTSLTVVGVVGPFNGHRDISVTDFKQNDLIATHRGIQLRLSNIQVGEEYPYYAMPADFQGNQLKSYGGFFRYDVEYNGEGNLINSPDIILIGNGLKLAHSASNNFDSGVRTKVAAEFTPGFWRKLEGGLASREELMMALANVEHLLIRLQYIDRTQREVELVNIVMDSAVVQDRGLGSATFVEECRCPVGYSGLSCESCAPGYVRQNSGPWLGRCEKEVQTCSPGTYGDPMNRIPCRECPCPLGRAQNFARTCSLGSDGEPQCHCQTGYTGRRCEQCAPGYVGNPLAPRGSCVPAVESRCDRLGTKEELPSGQCVCKKHVTGPLCNQCSAESFNLNAESESGCTDCFCMGVTSQCSSSTWFRDVIYAQARPEDFALVSNYQEPSLFEGAIEGSHREVSIRIPSRDPTVYYWVLPPNFSGEKLTSYGGHLNYTVRYVPTHSGGLSRNTAPDVVIRSQNDMTIMHYRHDDIQPSTPQTYSLPIVEREWVRPDGHPVPREHLLMALANVSEILVKATYTTTTESTAISDVSLVIASNGRTGGVRATEVEQCQCPEGHTGLSCESCSHGYARENDGGDGLYLGLCKPCECNGHSDDCNPKNGECLDCRDNTEGRNCEVCRPGYEGNATRGTPYDCRQAPENQLNCDECNAAGTSGCDERGCRCKPNVVGQYCDQCREATYNLNEDNSLGCSDCFCSGVSNSCSSSRLYRLDIPMDIFNNRFTLTDVDGNARVQSDDLNRDIEQNQFRYELNENDRDTLYWSLSSQFVGNRILSYGGVLKFTVNGGDYYDANQDVILVGNGMRLLWNKQIVLNEPTIVSLVESDWHSIDRNGLRPMSRADFLTVLANLQSILVRATLHESPREVSISDVSLETAVSQNNQKTDRYAVEVEKCRCPSGYRGTSCESCDHLFFHDTRHGGGARSKCQRCPCGENAESCEVTHSNVVQCNCKPGYYGEQCNDSSPPPPHPLPENPEQPTITVTISSPTMQIVEFGQTIRLSCSGYSIVNRIPITVNWHKREGRLPDDRSYQDSTGTLVLSNLQYGDSGVYVCQAHSGNEKVEKEVTVSVGTQDQPQKPRITFEPRYVNVRVGDLVDIRCNSVGSTPITYVWDRLNGEISIHAQIYENLLRFPRIQRTDEGDYRCKATNAYAFDIQTIRVFVRDDNVIEPASEPTAVEVTPPRFTGRPGDEVRLHCTTQPDGTVIWSKTGHSQLPSHIYVSRGILIISDAQPDDSGTYQCVASAPGRYPSTASAGVHIEDSRPHVVERPVLQPLDEQYDIIQGRDFSLVCECSPGAIVKWTKVHNEFEPNVQQRGTTLYIVNAVVENRGVYVCVADSEGGSNQVSTIIEVEAREVPVIELYPSEPQTVYVGHDSMLHCRATSGYPSPTITWSRRDHRPLSVRANITNAETIDFTNVQVQDDGEYVCTAENAAGSVSATTSLRVQQSPILAIQPDATEIKLTVGDELKLECSAEGIPAPHVQWYDNVQSQDMESVRNAPLPRFAVHGSPHAVLQKHKVRSNDGGLYLCRAVNEAGSEEKYIFVTIAEKRGDVGHYGEEDDESQYDNQREREQREREREDREREEREREERERDRYGNDDYEREQQQREREHREREREREYREREQRERDRPSNQVDAGDSFTANTGASFQIDCNRGAVNQYRTWRRQDGRPLPHDAYVANNVLYFTSLTPNDAGVYLCTERTNSPNDFIVIEATIIVRDVPSITFNPSMPMNVHAGENVDIYCNATGSEPINVRWHAENNRPLPSSVSVYGNYLRFARITPNDAGRYYCSATNQHGTTNKSALVIVNLNEIASNRRHDNKYDAVEGDSVRLDCDLKDTPSHGFLFNWRREYGTLPYNSANQRTNFLHLQNVRPEDAGRYICLMTSPNGVVTEQHIDLRVNQYAEAPKNALTLEPAHADLRAGESTIVDCISSTGYPVEVVWERIGHSQLPYNIRQSGNQLVIDNAHHHDSGTYVCKCSADDGHEFTSEYVLNIAPAPARHHQLPGHVEHADVGSSAVLRCNSDRYPATRFAWNRQHGKLAHSINTTGSELHLNNIQVEDAGKYVCTATHNGNSIDIPTTLVVTGALPFFPQAPLSYIRFPKMEDAYMKFNFEVTFRPLQKNGLILYNSQVPTGGDYIALSLHNGFVEFRFNFGDDPTVIRSEKPVEINEWHTVGVTRVRKDGYLRVNDQRPVAFPTRARPLGLELGENMFLGAVDNFQNIPDSAVATKIGFVGCVSQLTVQDRRVELNQDQLQAVGTTACEPCGDEPCKNDGICLESQTQTGYTCVCLTGYTGKTCAHEGISCTPGVCGAGRCEDNDFGIDCYCPLNKTGDRCQYIEHLDESNLSFKDGSYAAYHTPKASKLSIKFLVRPENTDDGVILYVAESETSNGDFVAVVIRDKHIEFRFLAGARISVIRSEQPIVPDAWTEIVVGRRHGEGYLHVDKVPQQQTGHNPKIHTSIYLKTKLYVGGYDKRMLLNKGVEVNRGFDGCITGLEVSNQKIDMIHAIEDAANVYNCAETNYIGNEPEAFPSECPAGFGGPNCANVTDPCLAHDQCMNNGVCRSSANGELKCDCPLGFTGDICQYHSTLKNSANFKGDGHLEINRSAFSKEVDVENVTIAIMMSTTQPNGLLLWYGQPKGESFDGQDFLALAIVDGFLEFSFRLDSEESLIRNTQTRVDENARHIIVIHRIGNRAQLELDSFNLHGESRPTEKKISHLPGNVFLGGAPDISNFTGKRYTTEFTGCIHIIEDGQAAVLDFSTASVSGVNVDTCPNATSDDSDENDTEPPVV